MNDEIINGIGMDPTPDALCVECDKPARPTDEHAPVACYMLPDGTWHHIDCDKARAIERIIERGRKEAG